MPELPEVETVCRQLDPELTGSRSSALEVLDARWSPARCRRRKLEVGRRRGRRSRGWAGAASTCCWALDGGADAGHAPADDRQPGSGRGRGELDPSEGRRLYEGERSVSERHLRARFQLDDGRELWFTDPRRFGEAFLIDDAELGERFARLGVEPLSRRLHARRRWGRWRPVARRR